MPYAKLYYHFIWATKERLPLIEPAFEPDLYSAIAAKVQQMDGFVHAVSGTQDHVHLAASIPPKLAPAIFIGEVKGNVSHFINRIVKPDLAFYWQDEYGVLTFGEKNLPAVVRYIHNQKKHHADGTIVPAMEIDSPLAKHPVGSGLRTNSPALMSGRSRKGRITSSKPETHEKNKPTRSITPLYQRHRPAALAGE